MLKLLCPLIFFIFSSIIAKAQNAKSSLNTLQEISGRYIEVIDKKITHYTKRITSKTEKTLTKLSYWENKIKVLLQKTSPATAERLFGNNQVTFTSLLQQIKNGEALTLQAQSLYNKYRDDLTTNLKYLSQQKEHLDSGLLKKIKTTSSKMQQLNFEEDEVSTVQQFIKERKKLLFEQAYQQLGKSKYLLKINKESYYYTETLKNYKDLLNDSKKAEETGKNILNKIPAFQQFAQKNSMLASMFGSGNSMPTTGGNLMGLQTRMSIENLIQGNIAAGGNNTEKGFRQNIVQAQTEINKLKDKIANQLPGAGTGGGVMPDFKPNIQKSKTFTQRLEYGANMQFSRSSSLMPDMADVGLNIGYKINDKSVIGIGGSYKLGLGSIDRIRITNQGASLRTYTDWKLKKQFFISGGFEMNYLSDALSLSQLKVQSWQRSGLLGFSKKISVKSKHFKETKIQLLYDFLSQQHIPVSSPLLFRMGYNLK